MMDTINDFTPMVGVSSASERKNVPKCAMMDAISKSSTRLYIIDRLLSLVIYHVLCG